jgi:hypothetical protein
MAHQELHQRRRRIDPVHNRVKRCHSVKDRSCLWKGGRLRSGEGHLLCSAQFPGAPHPLADNDLIVINSIE